MHTRGGAASLIINDLIGQMGDTGETFAPGYTKYGTNPDSSYCFKTRNPII